jgi:hypothetical protein
MTLLAAACASGGGGGGGGGGEEVSQDRNRLTFEDLVPYQTQNLYEAIRRARRFWFQGSGGRQPRVFVNDVDLGGPTSLQEYMPAQIAEITFTSPTEAMASMGPDYAGGVIRVTLR